MSTDIPTPTHCTIFKPSLRAIHIGPFGRDKVDQVDIGQQFARFVYRPGHWNQCILVAGVVGHWAGISRNDIRVLSQGTDNDAFYEVWDRIVDLAEFIETDGSRWRLFEGHCLWLVQEVIPETGAQDEHE